jgi:hypothetical protein
MMVDPQRLASLFKGIQAGETIKLLFSGSCLCYKALNNVQLYHRAVRRFSVHLQVLHPFDHGIPLKSCFCISEA